MTDANNTDVQPTLLVDGLAGIYTPQLVVKLLRDECHSVRGIADEDLQTLLKGPDHEHYDEAWQRILDSGIVGCAKCKKHFTLYQQPEGDVWAIPVGMVWDERKDRFVWPNHPNVVRFAAHVN